MPALVSNVLANPFALPAKKPAAQPSTPLNFIVAGAQRTGAAVVQTALNKVPGVVCHGDLFFQDYGTPDHQDRVRKYAHEQYYGDAGDDGWMTPESNPCRYLTRQVFDNPMYNESRIGARLLYHHIAGYQLYDFIEEQFRDGDFCVVHVTRNPIACFVSLLQAKRSRIWQVWATGDRKLRAPLPVCIDPAELIPFVRNQLVLAGKIKAACPDALLVKYSNLCFDYEREMCRIFEFLEIENKRVPKPASVRLRNNDMRSRIINFSCLKTELPKDVREYLTDDLI